ncbi:MAG: cysteine desulfurase [Clostridia bacterium]|nr:cysteine desulfurase [Clostridia bacterium]
MSKIKYFDHAATTKIDEEVLNSMLPFFKENYGNPSSVYSLGKINKEAINVARMKIANSINCKSEEIYFTSGGSESDNLCIKGIALANRKWGNHIITTKIEHPAVLNTCKFLEMLGFKVTYLNVDSKGFVNLNELEKSIRRTTILISVMFANNEIGTIQNMQEISKIAKKYRVYLHSDCVQAIGNIRMDMKKLNIDAISASGHKFYGPKGIGFAYVKEGIPFYRIIDGGHQERDKRSGTENVAGIVGIGKAIEIADRNLEINNKKLKELREYYIQEIVTNISNIKINGDLASRLPGNINICFKGVEGSELLKELDKKEICASSGSACSSGFLNPSHVLTAIGVNNKLARGSLRITFGKENTKEDVEYLVNCLIEIIPKLRK